MPALATSSRLLDVLTDLYDSTACCPDLDAHAAARNVDPKERKLFEALAKARHDNPDQSRTDALKSKEWQDLYRYVSAELTDGAEKGYGKELVKLDFDTPDQRLLSKLTESLHWFSANKNWQLLVDLNAQLKTTEGKLREWADFKKEALRLDKQYNTVWLRTEYNAAVASSQMAAKWVGFEERQDETYLRFDTAGDRRVRPAHVLLDGITLPATDLFWSRYYPPLDWNCRCDVTEVLRTRAQPTDLQQKGPMPQIAEGFKSNVGKSGQVFDSSHPYFQGVPAAEQAQLQKIVQASLPLAIDAPVLEHLEASRAAWRDQIRTALVREGRTAEQAEQLIAKAQTNIESLVADKIGRLRVGGWDPMPDQMKVLETILNSRFKSQFETGTSSGMLSTFTRDSVEREMFGFAKGKLTKANRPIYGFLSDAARETHGASDYGAIHFKFKPGVLSRATVTGGDSLDNVYRPTPVRKVGFESFVEKDELRNATRRLQELGAAKGLNEVKRGYVELQFHQRLTIDAIETIYVPDLNEVPSTIWDLCRKKGIALEQESD